MTPQGRIQAQVAKIPPLRGGGPVPSEFYQWVDETALLLRTLYGDEAPEAHDFVQAVREQAEGEEAVLHLEGPWGIFARLDRGEAVLRALVERAV